MKKKAKRLALYGLFIFSALILGMYLVYAIQVADAATKTTKPAKTKAETKPASCVTCHSFEELAAGKASFKTESGDMVNPHRYIPHNEKKPENVPDCTNCHTEHPNPPTEKIDLSKVDINNCYLSCHHQQNFEPCGKCHKHK